ncbi:hypothetical protein Vadar_013550 [Vaccinium darrowii]|uniref:Uncharacterized protein n=1 Tax=Vaccinium darrowii TaxID=229202 RepID=A0ACB7YW85_9ERIC|nr:hypothetical protein Vadar_013550 [Vaccinium darrowii]
MGKRVAASSPPSFVCKSLGEKTGCLKPILRRLSTVVPAAAAGGELSEGGGEVVVTKGEKKLLFPKRRRPSGFWTCHHHHHRVDGYVPADIYWLGDAIMQASKNMNKLLEKLPPSELIGRVNEQDDCYELRYEVPPGVFKEDVKITVDQDCVLTIKAGHKKEEDEGCSTRHLLPEDAKVDEIKAQMNNGVLIITIPRSFERPKEDVKKVQTR